MRVQDRMSRRSWLHGCLALAGGLVSPQPAPAGAAPPAVRQPPTIDTVAGPIAPERLGTTLMHEHVLVDFIGAADVTPSRYDADAAFRRVLPHLLQVREHGCTTLVECTPAFLARDVGLLRRLSEASGVHILTNTGYYGAAKDKFVPAHAYHETAAQLAERWVREWTEGIEGTGIRPAFMKIGVDEGRLSEIDAKLVEAAALTHRQTGLPIHSHTGNGVAALEQLDLLDRASVPLSAFIWVHAQSEKDESWHVRAAKRGAWVEFDGIAETTIDRHVALVSRMKAQGLLERVLVSQDAGWYRVGEPEGGQFRPYHTIFTRFIPALEAAGVSTGEVQRLLVDNPREVLTRRRP